MKVIKFHEDELWVEDETLLNKFRSLNGVEKQDLKAWAMDHLKDKVKSIWHPIIQDAILRKQARIA